MNNLQHRLYSRWKLMRLRCNNKKCKDYPNYGGRGITVCDEWSKFKNFLKDMESSFIEGLQLDRIDNERNYEPSNCRWVTGKENCRNKRNNVIIDTPNGPMTVIQAAEEFNLKKDTIANRRRINASISLTQPVHIARKINSPLGELTVVEASKIYGLPYDCLKDRINRGWSSERILAPLITTNKPKIIDTPQGKMSMTEACKVSGLDKSTLFYRINAGWSAEKLFKKSQRNKINENTST